jgi:murein DD-endopeptidase MepM/ murein hydrolase activator NlpD
MSLKDLLAGIDLFPILGKELTEENTLNMDFTIANKYLTNIPIKNTSLFNQYIFDTLSHHKKTFGIGGYLENRVIYQRSDHFQQGEPRCMHLGVDIWAKAFTPVYAPISGKIHSFKDNNNFGDYGPTIILEHNIENNIFYSLYGHLSRESLTGLKVGQQVEKGQHFCDFGPFPENGDWPPHLHFQLIINLQGRKGDFPGVCAPSELDTFQQLCPNANWLIK